MHHGDAEIGDQDRSEDLCDEGPAVRPQLGCRDDRGQQRDGGDAGQDEGFVDRDVDTVTGGIGAVVVPLRVIRDDPLHHERRGNRDPQNREQPVLRGAGGGHGDARTVEADQHERHVAVAGHRLDRGDHPRQWRRRSRTHALNRRGHRRDEA